jgi:hypothetical protein
LRRMGRFATGYFRVKGFLAVGEAVLCAVLAAASFIAFHLL